VPIQSTLLTIYSYSFVSAYICARRSQNLPPTSCARLYNQHYQPYQAHANCIPSNSQPNTSAGGLGGGRGRERPSTGALAGGGRVGGGLGSAGSCREVGGESVPTRGASASSGRMADGDNVEGGGERDKSRGPVSGSLLVPGTTLGVHRPHSRMLMQAREEVKNARVMTGLLRDSLLLSHDEASARLAEVS